MAMSILSEDSYLYKVPAGRKLYFSVYCLWERYWLPARQIGTVHINFKVYIQVRADHPDLIKLQEAIEKECKIREGANKLLQLSKNNRQNMEASKSLFVSNMKILEHMKKVQQVQQELKAGVDIKDHKYFMIILKQVY